MRLTAIAATLVAALAIPTPADAYVIQANTQPGTNTTLYLNWYVPLTLPYHYDILLSAAAKLNSNPSNMRFTLAVDNDWVTDDDNGESEVNFISNSTLLCGSIACEHTWVNSGDIVESDVYFDINYDWTLTNLKADSAAYDAGQPRPLLNTAMHEFSHSLGMGHESDDFQILGDAWTVVATNDSYTYTVLSEDTSQGLVVAYGLKSSSLEDISLYHWERSGTNSVGGSTHDRTPLLNSSGGSLSTASSSLTPSEPAWDVTRGQTIQVRLTAENRGKTTQSLPIKYYMSTNDYITTYDTYLATSTPTIGRNTPYTFNKTLTLPSWMASGSRYWIGAIIDASDTLSESNEYNNAIYLAEILVQ